MFQPIDKFIRGGVAGFIYGLVLLAYAHLFTKNVTHVHDLDFAPLHDLVPFLVMGLCLGGLLGIADAFLQASFEQRIPSWLLATGVWAVFVVPSMLLHLSMPERFEINVWQHLQGLVLAGVLGLIYSALGRIKRRSSPA
jgi:drug/metabolite transporter (DMT)-like permease